MNSNDLDLLTRDVYKILGCPVMVVDIGFHAVSWHCPAGFSDAPFRGSIARGSLTYETGSFLVDSEAGARYVQLEDSPYRRRFSPLITGGVTVGYLILVDVDGALENTDPQLFPAMESALAKQLSLEGGRGGVRNSSEETVLTRLLEGGFADEALFALKAESVGLARFAPRRLALVNLELYRSANWSENALRSAILELFPGAHPLVHRGSVVFFLNSEPDIELFRGLSRQFSLCILISPTIDALARLPRLYAATCELMDCLLPHIPHPFAERADGYQALLMLKHLAPRDELVLPSVRALARHDAENQSLFCLTLYTYLSCHHSLKDTCAALYTHRNTVLYRIHRMEENFGIPLDDPGQHLALLTSAALMLMELGDEAPFLPGSAAQTL